MIDGNMEASWRKKTLDINSQKNMYKNSMINKK